MRTHGHYIAGAWCDPASGEHLDTFDPATGEVWARIARGNADDASRAVRSAHKAGTSGSWANASPCERADALEAVADLLQDRWEDLVEAEVHDNGKRIAEVRGQFAGLHTWYRHFADMARELTGTSLTNSIPGVACEARYEPFGVVAAITPWNSPLMIAAWKVAPALAAGNTIVVKPSEHASVSTLLFAELVGKDVLPSGVLNVVTGLGQEVGEALVRHPLTRKVTFTGSDAGGRKVAEAAASGPVPVTLELGGKSPQIVFADADLDTTVNGIFSGIFLSNGQTCVAGSRLIVEAGLHDRLVNLIAAKARTLGAGDPMDPTTEIAPLANAQALDKVMSMIGAAKGEGAHCVTGGNRLHVPDRPEGLYVAPTVFTGVTPGMALWKEEVFGPVLAVTAFETEDEALALANDTDYGLAAGVWTSDFERARRLAGRIDAGTVYINHYRSVDPGAPIGGYKCSGYGRELGPDAVRDYQQVKAVWVGSEPIADPFPGRV